MTHDSRVLHATPLEATRPYRGRSPARSGRAGSPKGSRRWTPSDRQRRSRLREERSERKLERGAGDRTNDGQRAGPARNPLRISRAQRAPRCNEAHPPWNPCPPSEPADPFLFVGGWRNSINVPGGRRPDFIHSLADADQWKHN